MWISECIPICLQRCVSACTCAVCLSVCLPITFQLIISLHFVETVRLSTCWLFSLFLCSCTPVSLPASLCFNATTMSEQSYSYKVEEEETLLPPSTESDRHIRPGRLLSGGITLPPGQPVAGSHADFMRNTWTTFTTIFVCISLHRQEWKKQGASHHCGMGRV